MKTFAPPDTITIIRARSRRLAKLIETDGTISDYDAARTFDLFEVHVADLADVGRLLHRLLARPDSAVVRGAIRDSARTRGVRRLAYADKETGDAPTLREAAHYWLALDMENVKRPDSVPAADLVGCAAETIRHLPVVFHGARCIAQASAGHGIKAGCRVRLWYWLDRPTTDAELTYWLHDTPADPSVFRTVQPIYTAAPIFAPGIGDHLPSRLVQLPGEPVVDVPPPEKLRPPPLRRRPSIDIAATAGSARADLYVRAALKSAATRIVTADKRHPVILSEACGLGRLVHAGLLRKSEMKALLWQAAQRAGKNDESEIDRIIEFGMKHAGTVPLPEGLDG